MSTALLRRETFTTSRLAEFCSRKESTLQTSHPVDQWPLVVLKELVDDALDACEEADIAPVIKVAGNAVTGDITITDNGSGIPPETIKGLLDFNVRGPDPRRAGQRPQDDRRHGLRAGWRSR